MAEQPGREAAPKPKEKRSGDYHHGDLRRALVHAAIGQLATRSAREVSLRELARELGVSTAAPYRHFPSRNALIAAVAEEGFRGLAAEIRETVRDLPDDPLVRLRETGVAYVRFAHRHRSHYRVMFAEELADRSAFPELAAAAKDSMGLLIDPIEAGLRQGRLREGDPRELALAAWAVVHGLASLIGANQVSLLGLDSESPDALARTIANTLIDGVALPG